MPGVGAAVGVGYAVLGVVALVAQPDLRTPLLGVDEESCGENWIASDGLCYECAGSGATIGFMLLVLVALTAAGVAASWSAVELLADVGEQEAERQQSLLTAGGKQRRAAAKLQYSGDRDESSAAAPLPNAVTAAKILIDHFRKKSLAPSNSAWRIKALEPARGAAALTY